MTAAQLVCEFWNDAAASPFFNTTLGFFLCSLLSNPFQVAKAVSHSLNNCVNCLPGQKDVDMALKSIGEASKKLLIETVSLPANLNSTVASFALTIFFSVKNLPFVYFSDPACVQVLPGGPERVEPNGRRLEPVGRRSGPRLPGHQQPAGRGLWEVQPGLRRVPGCRDRDGRPHAGRRRRRLQRLLGLCFIFSHRTPRCLPPV